MPQIKTFKKTLRKGQKRVVEEVMQTSDSIVRAQLPTGYGKTLTAMACYSVLKDQGRVNRLLYIVPTTAQLDQIVQDGGSDMDDACIDGSHYISNICYFGAQSIIHHRKDTHQVFAVTVQSLLTAATKALVRDLMETGRWMVCVDEYHHYGLEKAWGKAITSLNSIFTLALSATPYRPDNDSALGKPDIVVTYEQAVEDHAVKPLRLHSYEYQIDAVMDDGEIRSFSTEELAKEAGSDDPEALEKVLKQLRWSPKYVSPLVEIPLERMQAQRLETGYPLQALIGALCCSHAKLVCDQVSKMFPEMRVDWVGTGSNGRTDAENAEVLKKFCPPKVNGVRRQEDVKLDVLVHVGKAGEGLDTVFVSEVIHLNTARINNSNHQENGRAARYLKGVRGYINVDSASPYAKWDGDKIQAIFDDVSGIPPEKSKDDEEDDFGVERSGQMRLLPDEPRIIIQDARCVRVNTGEIERFQRAIAEALGGDKESLLEKLREPEFQAEIIEMVKREKQKEMEAFNHQSVVTQWSQTVETAVGALVTTLSRKLFSPQARLAREWRGEKIKAINSRKAREIGAKQPDVALLKKHYQWLRDLEAKILAGDIPNWLR